MVGAPFAAINVELAIGTCRHHLPMVRAEAAPVPAIDARPPSLICHRHPCVTTWADGQSGRTLSGEDRCVHSLITLCCVILGQPQASAAHQGVLCGEGWRHRLGCRTGASTLHRWFDIRRYAILRLPIGILRFICRWPGWGIDPPVGCPTRYSREIVEWLTP